MRKEAAAIELQRGELLAHCVEWASSVHEHKTAQMCSIIKTREA